ncbi:MAG: IS3 family transposase [Ignavibacteriaceae bacterium]
MARSRRRARYIKKSGGYLHTRTEKRYKFIEKYRAEFRIVKMAEVMKVSKSGYYQWRKRYGRVDPEEESWKGLIDSIYEEHRGRYGYRRITKEIRRRGLQINKKHVRRLMKEMNLRAITPRRRKKKTNSDHREPISENILNREFKPEQSRKVWLSDITYIKTTEGWLYLTVVMDLSSRRILSWVLSETLEKESVIQAFVKASQKYEITADAIFHSDRGKQYASYEFRGELEKYGFRQSISGTGNCYDNAPMESFFHTLKNELLIKKAIDSKLSTRLMIFEYIEFYYNKKRLHSSLKYRTPDEVFFS